MRIDSHQHFWRYDPDLYPWIGEEMEVLRRDFLVEHLQQHLDTHAIDGCIAVQARDSLDETRFLLDLARSSSRVRGVVGWVDLCAANVDDQLEGFAGEADLKGIRHIVQDEPDDTYLLREDFANGIAALEARGLTYDVLVFPRHLSVVRRFLERHPAQPFVLDHLAKPEIASGLHDDWARDLRAVAEHPHLSCKLSGLVTEADWAHWTQDDLRRFLDTAYEVFGEDRVLFGSDWPVCLLAAGYDRVIGALETWSKGLDRAARAKLFGDNAARFYGLLEGPS